jgi:hypothetical protein
MRRIAVIGAGQAGLLFAHALLAKGYRVTLFSDRSAEQWLASRPTGTAILYGEVVDIERELGLDHWSGPATHTAAGGLVDFFPRVGAEPLVVRGRVRRPSVAIDQRLKFHHWMNDFEARGGSLEIASVTPEQADEIAAEHDLLVLAAGKAELASLVPRDAAKSVYDRPQRNLAMAILTGVGSEWADRAGFNPVKFNLYGDAGEFFWVPYNHKTAGATWCPVFEARFGGPLDRFASCRNGSEVVEAIKAIVKEVAPQDYPVIRDASYVDDDPGGWLVGRFPPTVRAPFGKLPSGRLVIPIGDTAITFDPVGGQGANCATRNARFVADAVITRGDLPFDEEWMTDVSRGFWEADGRWAYTFNNMLLEPLTEAGQIALRAAAEDEWMGTHLFLQSFATPRDFFPWIEDPRLAAEQVERLRRQRASELSARAMPNELWEQGSYRR